MAAARGQLTGGREHNEVARTKVSAYARVEPIGGLPLGDEGGVYRQRIAPSRLKSTARRLVRRRADRRDNAQVFRAARRNTALRSPRTLLASAS
jgi:hypothetical protein